MATTNNMLLVLPDPGVTIGPLYATENNAAFTRIDQHDHTTGNGVTITPDGMSITKDLTFANNNATNLKSARLYSQSSALTGASDLNCIFAVGNELYYRDGLGNAVQMTLNGAVNTSTSGAITGMGATTASVSYSSVSKVFTFASNTGVPGGINAGPLLLSPAASNTYRIGLNAPTLSANYDLTFPATLGAGTNPVFVDNSGNITYPTNVTMPGTMSVTGTLTAAAAAVVTTTLTIGSAILSYVTTSPSINRLVLNCALQVVSSTTAILQKFSSSTRTLEIADSSTGTARPIVVSAAPATHGLMIVRGYVASTGTLGRGEGFSSVRNSIGNYTLTFSTAFATAPVVVASIASSVSTQAISTQNTETTTSVSIFITNGGSLADAGFEFIAVGERSA